ncbi:MAG: lytic transglycosylase domain-containing protein, partial [Comamonadaceae bacterium]
MQLIKILTPLIAAAVLAAAASPAMAQNRGDEAVLEMQKAFRKGDRQSLTGLLPYTKGHPLEPWAAYWELKARLT